VTKLEKGIIYIVGAETRNLAACSPVRQQLLPRAFPHDIFHDISYSSALKHITAILRPLPDSGFSVRTVAKDLRSSGLGKRSSELAAHDDKTKHVEQLRGLGSIAYVEEDRRGEG
jgi:hypothetical protein